MYIIFHVLIGTCFKTDLKNEILDQWSVNMTQPTRKVMYFPLISHGNLLYLIGGFDSFGNHSAVISMYDIINDVWSENHEMMPIGRSKHCAVQCQGEFWIIGGYRYNF